MPEISGTCATTLQSQTLVPVYDQPAHQIGIMTMRGNHTSADEPWNNAVLTYSGMVDLVNGTGRQDGYFSNQHPSGDTSGGSFEADVSMIDGMLHLDGKWHLTFGTGTLKDIKGGGHFEATMTSSTDALMTWSGAYEL